MKGLGIALRAFIAVCFVLAIASQVRCQDIRSTCSAANCTITSQRPWSDFNHTYIVRPTAAQNSLYIFIANRNTTNPHSLTLAVWQTPSNSVSDFTNNRGFWVQDSLNGNCTIVANTNMQACWVTTMFASQLAIVVSGAGALSGSPDTGDIFITQGVGEPKGQGAGVSFTTDSYQSQAQLTQRTFALSNSFTSASNKGSVLLVESTGTGNIYFNRLLVSSTVAATLVLSPITGYVGCSNYSFFFAPTSLGNYTQLSNATFKTCADTTAIRDLTGPLAFTLPIPANQLVIVPLTDYYVHAAATHGLGLYFGADYSGGTLNAVMTWSEQ